MRTRFVINRAIGLGALALMTVLAGCSGSSDADKRETKSEQRTEERTRKANEINAAIKALENNVQRLERENQLQSKRIAAAKTELSALQDKLELIRTSNPKLAATTLTLEAPVAAPIQDFKMDIEDSKPADTESREKQKSEGERGVASTIAIFLFAVFVVIYIVRLIKGRPAESAPASSSAEPAPAEPASAASGIPIRPYNPPPVDGGFEDYEKDMSDSHHDGDAPTDKS
ncbi:MAG: hypothetical protein K1X53_07040 [Candidatus Sumerlaeaceae bacterium]|nr:hypothetical protein [Candidatus Sumerlaeaceae bacterium]